MHVTLSSVSAAYCVGIVLAIICALRAGVTGKSTGLCTSVNRCIYHKSVEESAKNKKSKLELCHNVRQTVSYGEQLCSDLQI